ncbi:hypothetical protein LXA43DRAFT_197064 [Ganoderma leucocontextum]|nr:hypothetical protein LXA43DRAFT_197064 [Ganoderma leucocontextum]
MARVRLCQTTRIAGEVSLACRIGGFVWICLVAVVPTLVRPTPAFCRLRAALVLFCSASYLMLFLRFPTPTSRSPRVYSYLCTYSTVCLPRLLVSTLQYYIRMTSLRAKSCMPGSSFLVRVQLDARARISHPLARRRAFGLRSELRSRELYHNVRESQHATREESASWDPRRTGSVGTNSSRITRDFVQQCAYDTRMDQMRRSHRHGDSVELVRLRLFVRREMRCRWRADEDARS